MARQVLFRSPPVNRRQPLLTHEPTNKPQEKKRIGEVAGGTAAECAAICCCCPCTVMNLLVLAVYKVPAGLCRKALKKRKRQRMMKKKNGLLQRPTGPERTGGSESETKDSKEGCDVANEVRSDEETEAGNLEKEMWDRFYGAGFWRSPSQRHVSDCRD